MIRTFYCTLIMIGIALISVKAQSSDAIVIGKKYSIHSEVLQEEREYWISLPYSYDNPAQSYKEYPLLILLDGHVHFASTVGMVQYRSIGNTDKRELPEMIIVGILNVDRERDFTPDKIITRRKNNSGGGDRFLEFLEGELIPTIDKNYRTIPYRILIGHSLGGLLAAHTYMKENTIFNAFVSIDPSFGTWDALTMDGKIAKIKDTTWKRPIYLATANSGHRNFRNRDRHVRFLEALRSKYGVELKARLDYFENKNHSTVPVPAIYQGLSFIFEGYHFSYRNAKSIEQVTQYYESFSKHLNYAMSPPEELVNRIGYRFLRSQNEEDKRQAVAFFKLNTKNYPKSYNAFDSLGEAQMTLGDTAAALNNFHNSLILNPENENAREKIKRIENK